MQQTDIIVIYFELPPPTYFTSTPIPIISIVCKYHICHKHTILQWFVEVMHVISAFEHSHVLMDRATLSMHTCACFYWTQVVASYLPIKLIMLEKIAPNKNCSGPNRHTVTICYWSKLVSVTGGIAKLPHNLPSTVLQRPIM